MRAMRLLIATLCLTALTFAKDLKPIKVIATHAVTHEARDFRAIMDKGLMGPSAPNRQVESYNLDTEIDGEKVVLACDDDKGCEAPALGTYEAEMKRRGHVHLTFDMPVTHKQVSRWYKVAGSW